MPSRAAHHIRLGRMLAVAAVLGAAAYFWTTPPGGRSLMPGTVLTSATNFALSGTVGNLAPGISSTLVVTATDPYNVPITLTSVTVSVPTVPASCSLSNLRLASTAFSGSPPAVTVTGLSQTVPANGSANVPLAILLAKNAVNGCQSVTFPFNYSGTATYTAATTTVLASSPNSSLFGHPVTFTATVTASPSSANPPVGTVKFYVCENPANLASGSPASACGTSAALGAAVTVNGSGQATLSTAGLPAGSDPVFASFTPSDATSYAASSSTTITQVVTFSKPCITTTVPGLTVAAGQSICVSAPGRVNGAVTVNSGGALWLTGATINGGLTSTGATALRVCGSSINGSVIVTGGTGFVMAGDGGDEGSPACAGNALGGVSLSSNSGGFEVAGNTITGSGSFSGNTGTGPYWQDAAPEIEGNSISGTLSCSKNNPAPTDGGKANTVTGSRSGQCSAAGF